MHQESDTFCTSADKRNVQGHIAWQVFQFLVRHGTWKPLGSLTCVQLQSVNKRFADAQPHRRRHGRSWCHFADILRQPPSNHSQPIKYRLYAISGVQQVNIIASAGERNADRTSRPVLPQTKKPATPLSPRSNAPIWPMRTISLKNSGPTSNSWIGRPVSVAANRDRQPSLNRRILTEHSIGNDEQ